MRTSLLATLSLVVLSCSNSGTEGASTATFDASCADACGDTSVVTPIADAADVVDASDAADAAMSGTSARQSLAEGWAIRSSAEVGDDGAAISTVGYATSGWHAARVPSTVLGALVDDGAYGDPYFGTNLRSIDASAFAAPWWYRTEFTLERGLPGRHVFLHLDGVNERAVVWMNGRRVDSDPIVGTFRRFELDVTAYVHVGANALAIEVSPPDLANDLTITWVDWNPPPPDRGMGLWREAYLTDDGPVIVRDPFVASKLDLPSLATAHLTVRAAIANVSAAPVTTTVDGVIDDSIHVSRTWTLAAGERRTITFDETTDPALAVANPQLWWPRDLGPQTLHRLVLAARVGDLPSETATLRFGIRDVRSSLAPNGGRLFAINGRDVAIRAAGYAPDLLLRPSWESTREELRYVDDLGLNALRLEGKLLWDGFFDLLDERGILVIAGWNCCDRWQEWSSWSAADLALAAASTDDESRRLRVHPSVVDFLLGSDEAPPPAVEKSFVDVMRANGWPAEISPSAADRTTPLLGRSGFKMPGPYDWVAPSYWELDTANGGAFGFDSETSPGPSIPELPSLRRMLSQPELDALWKDPTAPQFHAGQGSFQTLALFDAALAARYGAPTSLEDFVGKSQLANYEAERAMFEAYGRNAYVRSTGVVQWMLNGAWPSLIWHLYDRFLAPTGAYFGAKKANEPVHVQYSYDDGSIVVVNRGPRPLAGVTVRARVIDASSVVRSTQTAVVDVGVDAAAKALVLPTAGSLAGLSTTYFVDLALTNAGGELLDTNFYWLSTSPDALDFPASDWFHTPTTRYADLTALAKLPPATIAASASIARDGAEARLTLTLRNVGPALAFFVRVRALDGAGAEIVPALWSDDDVSILPGESRTLVARLPIDAALSVEVTGWNVGRQIVTP